MRNLIERALILGAGPTLDIPLPSDALAEAGSTLRAPLTLEEAERHHILAALAAAQWRIRGEGGAAEQLGIHEATLRSRMKKLGISRPPA
jgi:transcriptional regulator of acetoin/glycerol metabolism